MERHYEISLRTVAITLAGLAVLWLIIRMRYLFLGLFVSLVLCLALDSIVLKLKSWRIPRSVAVVVTFASILALFGGVISYGFTPMVNQTVRFLLGLPDLLQPLVERLGPTAFADQIKDQLAVQITSLSADLLNATVALASNSLYIFTILFIGFYLLLDWENVCDRFIALLNRPARKRAERIIERLERQLGGWVRGQLVLMIIVGLITFIGLTLLEVNYALPLALIAGVLEIVPMLGPIIAAVPAFITALNTSTWLGLWVLLLYVVIQQAENNFIVPHVMGRAVGFSPLATLIILFIGGELFGVGGVLLAIPAALFISIVIRDVVGGED